jgi:hypothetical protein
MLMLESRQRRTPPPQQVPAAATTRQPFSVTVVFGDRWAVPFVTYRPVIAERYAGSSYFRWG